jgi:APA family basic amino acid/polyamine antiporter
VTRNTGWFTGTDPGTGGRNPIRIRVTDHMPSTHRPGVAPGSLLRRKSIDATLAAREREGERLRRELTGRDLAVIGIGVIIGAGIFVVTGAAAATEAGPGVTLSFALAALGCGLAALCYAELASMVPAAGSAYTFAYASFGQVVAFMIGWDLALELTIGAAAVTIGWAGYLNATLDQVFGVTLPESITTPPGEGGVANLVGLVVLALLAVPLLRGVRMSARATTILVGITLAVLALVVVVGATEFDPDNWSPYLPFGWDGVLAGASLVFFAFIGFDIVATMAEETRDPARDIKVGILGSLALVTVLYIVVAGVVTGMAPYRQLGSEAPLADAFERLDLTWAAALVYTGALVALTKTVLVDLLGQSRVSFAMARDRLLPPALAATHPRFGTPHRISLIALAIVAAVSCLMPFRDVTEMVNIGTLFAFTVVAGGVLVLRRTEPDRERPFRTPAVWLVAPGAIVVSIALLTQLSPVTWLRFLVWMAIGLVLYFAWSRRAATAELDRAEARLRAG